MTKGGDCFVNFCGKLHETPAAILCVLLFAIQAGIMDYYLVEKLLNDHLFWLASDLLNLGILVSCIYQARSARLKENTSKEAARSFAWVSWLIINIVLAAKTVIIFVIFAHELEEEDVAFFGPNTLKTNIALGSCIFLLLLTTQHDAPIGSERRQYINELTGTVVFDLLDTADILEILFDESDTENLTIGLKEFILAVAILNLLIPTVPLLTLSITRFGRDRLQRRLIYLHRLLVVIAVNVPNLVVRLTLWHVHSLATSPFTLKNIILICITVYEFYLHKKEKFDEHERERRENETPTESERKPSVISSKSLEESFAMEQRVVTSF